MLGFGLGVNAIQQSSADSADPTPPEGFAFVTDNGEIVTKDGEPVYVPE